MIEISSDVIKICGGCGNPIEKGVALYDRNSGMGFHYNGVAHTRPPVFGNCPGRYLEHTRKLVDLDAVILVYSFPESISE